MSAGKRSDSEDAGHAFVGVYAAQLPRLRRIVAGMGFGPSDADDILQDVYLEASQKPGEYRGPEAAEHWLLRATVNRCLLEYRRRRRFRRAASEIVSGQASDTIVTPGDAEAGALRLEEIDAVRSALRELDGPSAAILALRYFCELDATRIGAILDLPPATVRGRLRAARLRLAEELTKRGLTK